MEKLITSIIEIRKSHLGQTIHGRMQEFRLKGNEGEQEIFKELCFCLLTANYTSEGAIRIQKAIEDGFHNLPLKDLAAKLKSLGYRFPNARARYIVEARKHSQELNRILSTYTGPVLREWFVENVLGLGYKEASHFLRNIGHDGFAIIDFHVIDVLSEYGIIERPKSKSLSKKIYLETEAQLEKLCIRLSMTQGELDLYLWYLETGKILK